MYVYDSNFLFEIRLGPVFEDIGDALEHCLPAVQDRSFLEEVLLVLTDDGHENSTRFTAAVAYDYPLDLSLGWEILDDCAVTALVESILTHLRSPKSVKIEVTCERCPQIQKSGTRGDSEDGEGGEPEQD